MKPRTNLWILLALLAVGGWMVWALSPDAPTPAAESERVRPAAAVAVVDAPQAADVGDSSVERLTVQDAEATATVPADPPGLRFEIVGVDPGHCKGVATLFRKPAGTDSVRIEGPQVSLPLDVDLRRVEFSIDGYCIGAFRGPFEPRESPITVHLERAGEILVRVVDTTGTLLSDRLVYCFPIEETEGVGSVFYLTTRWAYTDALGYARVKHALPGEYRISTSAVAEWSGADVSGVWVDVNLPTNCTLTVPVFDPDAFGGFTLAAEHATPLTSTPSGRIRRYRFWTEDGRSYQLFRIGDQVRCAVPGALGHVVHGRILWRTSTGALQPESEESSPLTVTVGAIVELEPSWSTVGNRP